MLKCELLSQVKLRVGDHRNGSSENTARNWMAHKTMKDWKVVYIHAVLYCAWRTLKSFSKHNNNDIPRCDTQGKSKRNSRQGLGSHWQKRYDQPSSVHQDRTDHIQIRKCDIRDPGKIKPLEWVFWSLTFLGKIDKQTHRPGPRIFIDVTEGSISTRQ